jgi:hypothetical protein
MYSITENIYCSQLSSVTVLLQPEPVFKSYSTRKDWVLSPNGLSPCGLPLPPTCLLVTANEARSYFASTLPCRPIKWAAIAQVPSFTVFYYRLCEVRKCHFGVASSGIMSTPHSIRIRPAVLYRAESYGDTDMRTNRHDQSCWRPFCAHHARNTQLQNGGGCYTPSNL